MLATSLVGSNAQLDMESFLAMNEIQEEINEVSDLTDPSTTQERVEEYFSDIPIMARVAFCESRYRQFNKHGSVLRGMENPADVGVMQINEKYHSATAYKLGIDLHTLEGNMEYARYLYDKQGTRPWKYSSSCWSSEREVAIR